MNICISTTAVGMLIAAALRNKNTGMAKGMIAMADQIGIRCTVMGKDYPEVVELVMFSESGMEKKERYYV